jgi:hypothetical protein
MELDLRAVVWLLWKPYLERKPQRQNERQKEIQKQRKVRNGPPRDPAYRAWIRTLPCTICGATWRVEAAHTGFDGGMSQKASDYSCVPLCKNCHTSGTNAYHRLGKLKFERHHGIVFADLVRALNKAWAKNEGADAQFALAARVELQPASSVGVVVDETPKLIPPGRETGDQRKKEVA